MPNIKSALRVPAVGGAAGSSCEEAGIFIWVIGNDRVYADSFAADLFGFDRSEARSGLPLKQFLDRIDPEDLPKVARSVRDGMVADAPFQEQYRIWRPDKTMVEVFALGCCFRDMVGEPAHYAGILFPLGGSQGPQQTMLRHLLAAFDLARESGNATLCEKLIDALAECGWQDSDLDLPDPRGLH